MRLKWQREPRLSKYAHRHRGGFILPTGTRSETIIFSNTDHADNFGVTLQFLRDLAEQAPSEVDLQSKARRLLLDFGETLNG